MDVLFCLPVLSNRHKILTCCTSQHYIADQTARQVDVLCKIMTAYDDRRALTTADDTDAD